MKFLTNADPFVPHGFKNSVELLGALPRVLVTRAAHSRMWHYVDIADKEVGWLGTAERLPSGDLLIGEVFLLKQEVHATTTEISADGVAELAQELISTRTDGVEVANAIRFWGHSHVRMGTSPSGQDESQMSLFRDNDCDWFIRGILNKSGRMEFTIFDWAAGLRVVDAAWALYEPADERMRSEIEVEFAAKVSEKRFPVGPHESFGWWREKEATPEVAAVTEFLCRTPGAEVRTRDGNTEVRFGGRDER